MRRLVLVSVLAASAAVSGAAQERRGPPPPPPDAPGRPQDDDVGPRDDERLRLWRRIEDEMSPEERAEILRLPPEERRRRVRDLAERRRGDEERAFLATLTEAERREIKALESDPDGRAARLLDLRVRAAYVKAVEEARRAGVAVDEPATAPASPREIANRTLELQKKILIAERATEWKALPADARAALEALPPRAFFADPRVRALRPPPRRSMADVDRLRGVEPEVARRVVAEIESGQAGEASAAVFGAERAKELGGLPDGERRRLAADLRRACALDDAQPGPDAPRPPGDDDRPPGPGWRLPPRLFDELAPAERREFLRASLEGQVQFARRRFGDAKLLEARRQDFLKVASPALREAFLKLAQDAQDALMKLSGPELRAELHRQLPGVVGPPRPPPPGRREPPPPPDDPHGPGGLGGRHPRGDRPPPPRPRPGDGPDSRPPRGPPPPPEDG